MFPEPVAVSMEAFASNEARAVQLAEAKLAEVKRQVNNLHQFYETAKHKRTLQDDRTQALLWAAQVAAIEEVQRIIESVENDNGLYVVEAKPIPKARPERDYPIDTDTRCHFWAMKGYQYMRCEGESGHESHEIDPGRPHFNGWHRWSPQESVVPPEGTESV